MSDFSKLLKIDKSSKLTFIEQGYPLNCGQYHGDTRNCY
jgi:hypothetical protein